MGPCPGAPGASPPPPLLSVLLQCYLPLKFDLPFGPPMAIYVFFPLKLSRSDSPQSCRTPACGGLSVNVH